MPDTTQLADLGASTPGGEGALSANTILQNRYKILGQLGGGGMGTVYQARDLNFPDVRKLVAVKEMSSTSQDPAQREQTMRTFRREANILATLDHAAIPKIYDFFDRDGRAYIIMEYIHGGDLEQLLNKARELPVDKVVDWAVELCEVLHYLHKQEPPIVFRDVKPSNIMIDSAGRVRLIDFGIAKAFERSIKKHTTIGTEGYSAPEQYSGEITPLSDIYGLGATLHHVLTRKDPRLDPPFSFHERPIQDFNSKVPDALARIIERALASNVADRFHDMEDMRNALLALRHQPAGPSVAGGAGAPRTQAFAEATGGVVAPGAMQPRWVFEAEDEIRCSPALLKDTIFVGSYDTNVWALRQADGSLAWKYATRGGIAASPAVYSSTGMVYVGSEDCTFNALDVRNGRLAWSHTTRERIRGTARVAHDHVFFGCDDNTLYALNATNGRTLWTYDAGAPIRSRPWITADLIIFGSDSGEVTALELSGQRKWSARTRRAVFSSPFVDERDGFCYIGSMDGFLYAIDITNGFVAWRFRTNNQVLSSPVASGTLAYIASTDNNVYAVNVETAREKWRVTMPKPVVASPLLHEDALYIGGTDGNLYCLDARTGKERWCFATGGPITSTPLVAGDMLVFGSMDKKLYALPLLG